MYTVQHRVGRVLSWRERGWESPNSDEGAYTVVLSRYMYFVVYSVHEVLFDNFNFYINHDACMHVSRGTFVQR